ncbi:monocarboxylate transporter 12-B-like isoform X1 [Synchiropus splendidus]|uniref:monocarboxylate transporter 12-B-like isoform X1 n=1 Tax=Synchiropus splendidus TaxID=270530 RepID=UPI00237E99C8|nr:monocarboxylate transporter 12-B-like isoform X1 [Synchiropus splendidus]
MESDEESGSYADESSTHISLVLCCLNFPTVHTRSLATLARRQWVNCGSHREEGRSWTIVSCCFMVMVCTRAVTRCVSIFFVEFQTHFGRDSSATSWLHSLMDCSTMMFAPLGSFVERRWSCRTSVMLGGVLSSCGFLLGSCTTKIEHLYLSLGVMTGVGFSLCYSPSISLVGVYFPNRRSLAWGVAMSGSGIGTLVLAPLVQVLIQWFSWRGALLLLSAIVAHLCVCGSLMWPITAQEMEERGSPVKDEPPGAPWHWMRGRRFSFLLLCASFLLLASGCSLPFIYLVPLADSVGVSSRDSALLLSLLGVIGIAGNISFSWLTDRKCLQDHLLACYTFSVVMEGLACLLTPLLQSYWLLVIFATVYGYFDGAYVALIPAVTSEVVERSQLSPALSLVYFLHSFPYLLSPPAAGRLIDITGSYTPAFLLGGCSLLASATILCIASATRRREAGNS